ncbi:hypothetical protein SUZIE_198830 [Sciurus carolinensis]|uniref:Aftiphilin clathrin-binding box domain-containing protein n=1 Tax=Sciurus carolinensis TaxID=30640 RepID=A0AA41T585_SCICA|nr:hypothetical protein [Sciurus carolinensis]
MQGRQERWGESVSDFAGEPVEVSRRFAAEGQNGDSWEPIRIHCQPSLPVPGGKANSSPAGEGLPTCSCPDPGELSSTWGEFEGFQESSAKPGLPQSLELLERPTDPQPLGTPALKECGSQLPHQGGSGATGTTSHPSSEVFLWYENIFRFAFQEVTVEQVPEDVSTLDHLLEMSSEEDPGLASAHRLCSESRTFWRALQNTSTMSASRCLQSQSHCQEKLFLVLGIEAAQKSLSRDQGHISEDSDLKGPEELLAVSTFHLHHCRALIQTKLSGTPGHRQGSLIAYSLFLKTPLHGNGRYITSPQNKKVFPPRNLKLAFFNRDVC